MLCIAAKVSESVPEDTKVENVTREVHAVQPYTFLQMTIILNLSLPFCHSS